MRRSNTPRKRRFSLSTRRMRRVLSWKFVFYDLLLPTLRLLGATRGDAILGFLGRLAMALRPRRRSQLRASLERAKRCTRRRLVDRDNLAGAGSEHRQVPGPRLPARSAAGRSGAAPI